MTPQRMLERCRRVTPEDDSVRPKELVALEERILRLTADAETWG